MKIIPVTCNVIQFIYKLLADKIGYERKKMEV